VTVDHGAVLGARAGRSGRNGIGAGKGVIARRFRYRAIVRLGRTPRSCMTDGDRVIITYGALSDRCFGFVRGPKGDHKVPQIGEVSIPGTMSKSAPSTIDRGGPSATPDRRGAKIRQSRSDRDNVWIGRQCLLAAWWA